MKRNLLIITLILLSTIGITVAQSDNGELTTTAIHPVTTFVPEDVAPLVRMSSDGTYFIMANNGKLCVYTDASELCSEATESRLRVANDALHISPDGQYAVWSEDVMHLALESDLWLFDVRTATNTKLTDDGVEGPIFRVRNGLLDYAPMWHPDGETIYFFRSESFQTDDGTRLSLQLMRMSITDDAPQMLQDLTTSIGNTLPITYMSSPYFEGPAAVSPDGTTIAVIVYDGSNPESGQSGIWLLDLVDNGSPRQLMPYEQFAGLPDFAATGEKGSGLWPLGLAWSGDSSGLVVGAIHREIVGLSNLYYYDIASAASWPLADFSNVSGRDQFYEPDSTGIAPTFYSSQNAAVTPDGQWLLSAHRSQPNNMIGVSMLRLPPEPGQQLTLVYQANDLDTSLQQFRSTAAVVDGGYAFVALGYVFYFEE